MRYALRAPVFQHGLLHHLNSDLVGLNSIQVLILHSTTSYSPKVSHTSILHFFLFSSFNCKGVIFYYIFFYILLFLFLFKSDHSLFFSLIKKKVFLLTFQCIKNTNFININIFILFLLYIKLNAIDQIKKYLYMTFKQLL